METLSLVLEQKLGLVTMNRRHVKIPILRNQNPHVHSLTLGVEERPTTEYRFQCAN